MPCIQTLPIRFNMFVPIILLRIEQQSLRGAKLSTAHLIRIILRERKKKKEEKEKRKNLIKPTACHFLFLVPVAILVRLMLF